MIVVRFDTTMRVIDYSTRGYDKPYLMKVSAAKHDFIFTDKRFSLATIYLTEGCEAIAIFTRDSASMKAFWKPSEMGIKYVALQ